ncbi:MAG: glycosyltransferase family 9 protein [Bacteroidota bacterium]
MARKVLIIRFSSIGDIVLTSPIVRSLAHQEPDISIHYLTKPAFTSILQTNPHVDRVHALKPKLIDTLQELKQEKFDLILDLHHNLRTLIVKNFLGVKSYAFPKGNWEKYQMVKWKKKDISLPHIVERYADVLRPLGVRLDEQGLDFFISQEEKVAAADFLMENDFGSYAKQFYALVIGAKHHTKRWPNTHVISLIHQLAQPVILIGGTGELADAEQIAKAVGRAPVLSAVGRTNLQVSAALLSMAQVVITPDTGMMHIAAALQKPIISIWGNTVPEFGMYPYKTRHATLEVQELGCRPCSKIGFDRCPKGHFSCMVENTPERVQEAIRKIQS